MRSFGSRNSLVFLSVLFAVTASLAVAARSVVAAQEETADVAERVVAVVDGEILFLSDVRRDAVLFPSQEDSGGAATSGRLTDRLNRLIDRHLLLGEAQRFVPEGPTPQSVEAEASAVRARLGTLFQETLQKLGLDDAGFMARVRERAWIDRLLEERVRAFTFVSPKAVEAYRQGSKPDAPADEAAIRRILADRMAAEKERDLLLRLRKQATLQINEGE